MSRSRRGSDAASSAPIALTLARSARSSCFTLILPCARERRCQAERASLLRPAARLTCCAAARRPALCMRRPTWPAHSLQACTPPARDATAVPPPSTAVLRPPPRQTCPRLCLRRCPTLVLKPKNIRLQTCPTLTPPACSSAATRSPASTLRLHSITSAPACANAFTVSTPMPELPPAPGDANQAGWRSAGTGQRRRNRRAAAVQPRGPTQQPARTTTAGASPSLPVGKPSARTSDHSEFPRQVRALKRLQRRAAMSQWLGHCVDAAVPQIVW